MAPEPNVFAARRSREVPGLWLLSGIIDENADLGFLEMLNGPSKLDMKGIRRINSYGVRAWIEAIRKVPASAIVDFVDCPSVVIDQMNMVAGFLGRGRVVSFFAPMVCARCGVDRNELFQTEDYHRDGRLPEVSCPRCTAPMQVDDLEEHYLLFLREA